MLGYFGMYVSYFWLISSCCCQQRSQLWEPRPMVLPFGIGGFENLLSHCSFRLSFVSLRILFLNQVSPNCGKPISVTLAFFFLRLSAQTSVQENLSLLSLVLTTVASTKATTLQRLSTFALLTGWVWSVVGWQGEAGGLWGSWGTMAFRLGHTQPWICPTVAGWAPVHWALPPAPKILRLLPWGAHL